MRKLNIKNKQLWKAICHSGLKIYDIASIAEVSPSTIQFMLTGKTKNPRVKTAKKIANALQVSIDDLGFF